jgi:transcriptional regulator with XRE-family HTH domain
MESKLNELRTALDVSSTRLSHLMGVNQSTVLRYEQSERAGAISLSSLRKFAAALGYRLEYRFVKEKQNAASPRRHQKQKHQSGKRSSDSGRKASELSGAMKSTELAAAIDLDPVTRMKRAYELSCFVRKLKGA